MPSTLVPGKSELDARERFDRHAAGGPGAWGDADRELRGFLGDLRPGDPADEGRLLWHFARLGYPDAAAIAMFRRLADGAASIVVRRTAAAVAARFSSDINRVGERLAVAVATAGAARGSGGLEEVLSVLWCADGYLTQGRTLEALAASGRAMELADAADAPAAWARAAGLRVNLVLNLGLKPHAEQYIAAIEARCAPWTGMARAMADFEVAFGRMYVAMHDTRPDEALHLLETVDRLADEIGIPASRHDPVRSVVQSWALSALGRDAEALAATATLNAPPLLAELAADVNRVAGLSAGGHAAAALAPAQAFLHRIEGLTAAQRENCGPAKLSDLASAVAEPLAAGGDVPGSLRALDLAAVQAIARLAELQRGADAGQGVAEPTAEDHAILADARRAWADERSAFLGAVARALETAAKTGGMDIHVLLAERSEHVTACAWCGSVRAGVDRWIPFELYLPDDNELTHGACGRCVSRIGSGLSMRA